MNLDYLLMPLWATMQSWGDQVIAGDDHPTLPFPTHSGLCGMIGAALGLDRRDSTALHALHHSLNFILIPFCQGTCFSDFYSVQGVIVAESRKAVPERTIIGRKTYMVNSAFLAIVYPASNAPLAYSLEAIGHALLFPKFPLYAGHKSQPWMLPPVYHIQGEVPIYRWASPLCEIQQIFRQEASWQADLWEGRVNRQEMHTALFKNKRLPAFLSHPWLFGDDSLLRCEEQWTIQHLKNAQTYPVRDRYVPSSRPFRYFGMRSVYALSLFPQDRHALFE